MSLTPDRTKMSPTQEKIQWRAINRGATPPGLQDNNSLKQGKPLIS
uniref:Uncharacterized protein n=1 Tax=Arundo donax TaxID=35708 RepID=A0A0A9HQJ0_ARUDO